MVYESVREALDSLPEIYREVMTLRYFGGMTVKEMARFLSVSPNTIDRRLKGARIRLKEEIIAMMSANYQQHELPASFIFRIVEMVKRIRIHATPRATGLPWGLSLAAGIMITAMTIGSQMVIHELPKPVMFPGEIMPRVREMSVDILSAPQTLITAGNQGDINGGGIDPRNPQNASFLAPAKGGGTWAEKGEMLTARWYLSTNVVDGKIYAIGGATALQGGIMIAAVEEYDPAMDKWTKKANMPAPRTAETSVVDGKIYAFGGGALAAVYVGERL